MAVHSRLWITITFLLFVHTSIIHASKLCLLFITIILYNKIQHVVPFVPGTTKLWATLSQSVCCCFYAIGKEIIKSPWNGLGWVVCVCVYSSSVALVSNQVEEFNQLIRTELIRRCVLALYRIRARTHFILFKVASMLRLAFALHLARQPSFISNCNGKTILYTLNVHSCFRRFLTHRNHKFACL